MKQSKFLRINLRDLAHVFLVGLGAFLLNFAQEQIVPNLDISPEFKGILFMGIAYLGKKFLDSPEKEN